MINVEADWQIFELHKRGGRDEAFETFIKTYKPSLYALCYRIMQNADDAAEAWQEVLMQIDRSLKNFKNESSLYTWAYRIAVNVCTNLRRRLRRNPTQAAVDLNEISYLANEKTSANPDMICQASFKQRLVEKALKRLPENHQTILILHNLEGFTLKEISVLLGIKQNAAKARLRRATRAFKDLLQNDFENLGAAIESDASIGCTSKLN